jgi:hypothetical protein
VTHQAISDNRKPHHLHHRSVLGKAAIARTSSRDYDYLWAYLLDSWAFLSGSGTAAVWMTWALQG